MSDDTDRLRELRNERKRLKLGSDVPHCSSCGQNDIRCLTVKRRSAACKRVTACHNCLKKARVVSDASLARARGRFVEVGYDSPTCTVCAESDIRALELHHVAGHANSTLTVPCCANCHAMASDWQLCEAKGLLPVDVARSPLEKQAAFEIGVAILILVIIAVVQMPGSARIAGAAIAASLTAWAAWNIAADAYFSATYGADYSSLVPMAVPQ